VPSATAADILGVKGGNMKANKAKRDNMGNVPHLPKNKSAKDKKEEWLSNVVIRPTRPKN